jgi:hypothetical protein
MSASFVARLLPLVAAVALLDACATAPGAAPPGDARASRMNNSDVITRDELADPMLTGSTLLEAVRRLRPRFLSERGGGRGGTSEAVMVTFNGSDLMPVTELARLSVTEVTEIRYLNTAAAGQRFGLAGSNGPVLILTLKAR